MRNIEAKKSYHLNRKPSSSADRLTRLERNMMQLIELRSPKLEAHRQKGCGCMYRSGVMATDTVSGDGHPQSYR